LDTNGGISGDSIIFDAPDELGDIVTFPGESPPPQVIVNGKIVNLVR
jgi:hypothetical protein